MLYCWTRTLFTRTSKLLPFASTIPGMGSSKSWKKDNQNVSYKLSSPMRHSEGMSLHSNNHYAKKLVLERNWYLRSVLQCCKNMWTWWLATSTALRSAAHPAVIVDPLALLKKHSGVRAYQCHSAPHHCGDRVVCQVNGLTCGLWNRKARFGCVEPSPYHMARWGWKKRSKLPSRSLNASFKSMPEPMNARHGTISLSGET